MGKYLTFDIGGTDLKYGIIENHELVYSNKIPSEGEKGGIQILEKIVKLEKELNPNKDALGICVSSAGVINPFTGECVAAAFNIPGYIGTKIKDILEEKTGLKTWVLNDVNAMALAELNDGVAQELDNFFCMTVGTGIGGAIIIDKKMVWGHSYAAGEVGIHYTSKKENWENRGSSKTLVERAQKLNKNIKNGFEVFTLYDQGDKDMKKVVNRFYDDLSVGIANIIHILNPGAIVIGGGVTARGNKFINELKGHLYKYISKYYQENTKILIARYKNESQMIGAYYHFLDMEKKA